MLARLPLGVVYAVATLHATATVFFTPARYAVLPDIVAPSQLLQANSLDETSQSALDPVAYLVGGALVAAMGVRVSFSLDALTFAASAAMIAATTTRMAALWHAPRGADSPGIWHDMLLGLRHIWHTPRLRANTVLMLLASLVASAESPLTYMLVLGHWRTGAWGLGVVEAGLAVGIVAGSLMCPWVVAVVGRGLSILLGLLLTSFCMIAVAHLPFWPAVLVIALSGFCNMLFWIPTVNLQLELALPSAPRPRAERTAQPRHSGHLRLVRAGHRPRRCHVDEDGADVLRCRTVRRLAGRALQRAAALPLSCRA